MIERCMAQRRMGVITFKIQCISDIRPELGPGKIGLITNMALYQMLLWRGLEKGWKDSNELRWESGSKSPMIELLAPL